MTTPQIFINVPPPSSDLVRKQKKPETSGKKMGDLYSYRALSPYGGLLGHIPVRAGTTYVGVEIELEGLDDEIHVPKSWKITEDGSLKDSGREFVTVPIRAMYLEQELRRLFGALREYKTSSRCSTHVHLNVRDFTTKELRKFLLLYMVFEKVLFRYSGDRWNNLFCVPLYYFPHMVREEVECMRDVDTVSGTWYKYFGLNISPIFGGESHCLGTVEFRHMVATDSIEWIMGWINLIISLKISAKKMKEEHLIEHLQTMNTTSGYTWLTKEVFAAYAETLLKQPNFKEDIETCITQTKTVFLKPKETKELIRKL